MNITILLVILCIFLKITSVTLWIYYLKGKKEVIELLLAVFSRFIRMKGVEINM